MISVLFLFCALSLIFNYLSAIKNMKGLSTLVFCIFFVGTLQQMFRVPIGPSNIVADTIYYNGNIITMDQKYRHVEFVAVKDGKIIQVGRHRSLLFFFIGKSTTLVDLKGKTLLPGFIDSHSHFGLTAIYTHLNFSISSAPFGNVTSIPQMLQNMRNYIQQKQVPAGQKVYSYGYSDAGIIERRHPTRYELDSVSTVHPILLVHYSSHVAVGNSMALQAVGYVQSATPPPGGLFDRYPNGTLTGVVRSYAVIPLFQRFMVQTSELTLDQLLSTVQLYYSCGVTTGHDIFLSINQAANYKRLGDSFPYELNAYLWVGSPNTRNFYNVMANYSTSTVTVRGAKFILDGSINAYTALLTKPYWVPESYQFNVDPDYTYDTSRSCSTEQCGFETFPYPSLLNQLFTDFNNNNFTVAVHCNGDAALDRFLSAVEYARNNSMFTNESRFIAVHAQTARQDQLDRMTTLGVHPSFYIIQVYYWGDLHYSITLGPERANRMNPVKSSVKRKHIYTLHNDSPVIVNGLFEGRNTFLDIIDAAVNRKTRKGRQLGEEQRVTPYQALAGLTINAAWQSKSQKIKGSITVGKVADFVILSESPLSNNGKNVANLSVVATIKRDNLVYGNLP